MKDMLPKGLQEYAASLADPDYTLELIKRLPATIRRSDEYKEVEARLKVLEAAQLVKRVAVYDMQESAEKLWQLAVASHTVKQLQRATGYKDED